MSPNMVKEEDGRLVVYNAGAEAEQAAAAAWEPPFGISAHPLHCYYL